MMALIDSNNFYVSAERVFQPELRNRAGCVLSNNYVLTDEYKPDLNIAISNFGFVVTSDEPDLVQRMRFGIFLCFANLKHIKEL